MEFSVIIPTKNESAYLPILFLSISRQTLKPKEVIVADAGSADKTPQIALNFGARVLPGGLPSIGRNIGACNASTDLIVFLDADVDLQDKDFFKRAFADFCARHLDIATCDIEPIGGTLWDKFSHAFYNRYVRLWGSRFAHAPGFCIFVKKDLHKKIGGFDESIVFCEDHEYALRASKKGVFGFINGVSVPVSVRRMNKDGRLEIAIKYILAELYLFFVGPIRGDKFSYNFNYSTVDKQKEKD